MSIPHLTVRPGHPDFLDLPWHLPVDDWPRARVVELPRGVHRHPVVFVAYRSDIYAIKELPRTLAQHEFDTMRHLQRSALPVATPVGLVERPWIDPRSEQASAVITQYVRFAFPFRELVEGGGFGRRRNQMLDAFAGLLVQLHLAGCFWGDCSLSNVLYRYDAASIEAIMIDAETAVLRERLSDGQRTEDLSIMEVNVAGGMADVAASQGLDLDHADLTLGEDITRRYWGLWNELDNDELLRPDERFRINERVQRLNELGFEVEDVELIPATGGDRVLLKVAVGGRSYHRTRLRELTRIEASENQARQILSDLRYNAAGPDAETPSLKAVAAIRWRVSMFEPMLARITELVAADADPVQRYCDFLHHRYVLSVDAGKDVGNDTTFAHWVDSGMPGYPLA